MKQLIFFTGAVFNPKELLCNAVSNVICSIVFGHRFEYKDPEFLLLYDTVNAYFDVLNSPIGIVWNECLLSSVDK